MGGHARLARNSDESPRCQQCGRGGIDLREGGSGFEGQWFCRDCWKSWDGRSRSRSSSTSSSSSRSSGSSGQDEMIGAPDAVVQVPVPPQRFWRSMELPLDFRPSEDRSGYSLSCQVPAHLQDVKLELNPRATHLTISGVHLPTAEEVEAMQKQISFAA